MVEEAPQDVLRVEEAGGLHLEGVQCTGDSREGPFCVREVGSLCAAHMGELEAEGRRWVAPRHLVARPVLPSVEAAAQNWLRPIRYGDGGGRAWYEGRATWRRVVVLCCTHCAERAGVAVPTGGGGGGAACKHDRVHNSGCALPEHLCAVAMPLGLA